MWWNKKVGPACGLGGTLSRLGVKPDSVVEQEGFGPWQPLRVHARLRVKLVVGLRAPLTLPTSVPAVCYTQLSTFHRSGCARRIRN